MDWASVLALNPGEGEETGTSHICEGNRVVWMKNNAVYRDYRVEQPIHTALFANYVHEDPEELWVVVILQDQTVHSFSASRGQLKIIGLNFNPKSIFRCGKVGVAFTSVVGNHLNISVLQGPEELVQAVVPSSIMDPLSADYDLKFINEHVGVAWSETSRVAKIYTIKFLHQKAWLSSTGSDVSTHILSNGIGGHIAAFSSSRIAATEPKAAVSSSLREWKQESIGRVFTQELRSGKHESFNWLVAVHDPIAECSFVLSGMDLVLHDNVQFVTPIRGIFGVPLAILAVDNWSHARSLFFPRSEALGFPFPQQGHGKLICGLKSETSRNWVDIHFAAASEDHTPQRVSLFDDIPPEIPTCFNIYQENSGVEELFKLIQVFSTEIRNSESVWGAFRESFDICVSDFPPDVVSHLIFDLHLFREESALLETQTETRRELERLIAPYVKEWPSAWRIVYPLEPGQSEFIETRASPVNIGPPCVLEALINSLDPAAGCPLPENSLNSEMYPLSHLLNHIFQLISTSTWSVSTTQMILQLLKEQNSPENLENLAFSIRACVLQTIQLIDLESQDHWNEPEISRFKRPTPQDLFNKDLRFEEALRCLQTKEPQRCSYGSLVDPEKLSAESIMDAQLSWSEALSARAFATAYGRAAIDMEKSTPLLWDQVVAPPIDFSGVCSETGISIPPAYKSLQDATKSNPWGAFAHGAALGISISKDSKGIDSLWVMTSAKLKAESKEMYSGFIYGMGLSGHLKSLEDWQFYESLVNTDKYRTLAALVGVAASKLSSRDAKLTKVFSVHIRALLPKEMNEQHFVASDIENGALVALGLLYFGTGVRHLSHKSRKHLEHLKASSCHIYDGNGMESNEVYKFASGLSSGLINCGCGSVNNLDSLTSLIMAPHDENVGAAERVAGALVALICGYIGTNDVNLATRLEYTSSHTISNYMAPSLYFGRALARCLIMWDSIGRDAKWVTSQCSGFDVKESQILQADLETTLNVNLLNYFYWKAGVLVAMAMRHISSNNVDVIDTVCSQIENVFLPSYIQQISRLIRCRRQDSRFQQASEQNPNERLSSRDNFHFKYLETLFTRSLAQIIAHLVLAASATAAGTGNLRIMRSLRQSWQVSPQFQAFATYDDPKASEAHIEEAIYQSSPEVSIDLTLIAQSFGWLFMGSGQTSFKTDRASVALLTCSSFVQILGSANLDPDQWRYLRFLWRLVTEQRCLFAAENPGESVAIDIKSKPSGELIHASMPLLLPPFEKIEDVTVVDTKFMSVCLSYLSEFKISNGVRLTPRINHAVGLETMLKKQQSWREQRSQQEPPLRPSMKAQVRIPAKEDNIQNDILLSNVETSSGISEDSNFPLRKVLEMMARKPQSYQDQLESTLLSSFFRRMRPLRNLTGVFSDQWLEQVQLKSWLSQQCL